MVGAEALVRPPKTPHAAACATPRPPSPVPGARAYIRHAWRRPYGQAPRTDCTPQQRVPHPLAEGADPPWRAWC